VEGSSVGALEVKLLQGLAWAGAIDEAAKHQRKKRETADFMVPPNCAAELSFDVQTGEQIPVAHHRWLPEAPCSQGESRGELVVNCGLSGNAAVTVGATFEFRPFQSIALHFHTWSGSGATNLHFARGRASTHSGST